jgi:hypothetical protein
VQATDGRLSHAGFVNPWHPRTFVLFALLLLMMFPLHELAHALTYRAFGIPVRMTLNTASPADKSQRILWAELAGPMMNLVVGSAAVMMFRLHRRMWLAQLALAAAMMRLTVYVLIVVAALVTGSAMSLGNDEPIAAQLAHLPSLTFVGLLAVPFGAIVCSITKDLGGGPRRRSAYVGLLMAITVAVGIFIGNILDPWLFG